MELHVALCYVSVVIQQVPIAIITQKLKQLINSNCDDG